MTIKNSPPDTIPLAVIGISHHTASIEIREKVSFTDDEYVGFRQQFTEKYHSCGLMVLSTCNRTEIYISGEGAINDIEGICLSLDNLKRQKVFRDKKIVYTINGIEAVYHFFRVIASLDSQMVGEPQITGQVKDAYEKSRSLGHTGILINKMFNFGMQAEKQVRSKTYLTDGAVSVSYAGVELARKIFGDLKKTAILLVGAGETAELAATHFFKRDVSKILVANRTFEKAKSLADKFNGEPINLENLESALDHVDIVITATASSEYVVTKEMLKKVSKKRDFSPIFLIDLAIPRDVDPASENVDGVFLYNLDSLQEIVNSNRQKRENEIPKAEKIVKEHLNGYVSWFKELPVIETITQLNQCFEEIREKEYERLKNRFSDECRNEAEYLSRSLMKKFLHQHIKTLRQNNLDQFRQKQHIDLVNEIYQLNGAAMKDNTHD